MRRAPRSGTMGPGEGEVRLRLSQLLARVDHQRSGHGDPDIVAVTHDSRQVRPGSLFAAFRGHHQDGRAFVAAAIAAGASAVLAEGPPPEGLPVPWIGVPRARAAAGQLAARLAGDPAEKLLMVGVTGTSGKTTTTLLIDRMLSATVGLTGLFGTLVYRAGAGEAVEAARTTPESTELQPMLAALLRAGGVATVMECSSHAIDLDRLAGCRFDVAVFTNLSRDHLDYHPDLDAYFEVKARLFSMLKPDGLAVVNVDDRWGEKLIDRLPFRRTLGFSLHGSRNAIVTADATIAPDRTRVAVRSPAAFTIDSPLPGAPNAENLLGAASVGLALGIAPERIAATLGTVDCIPGRMERIPNQLGLQVLVDYAHKPAALEGVLRTCRALARPGIGRVIVVFGCGGDRDRGKRPQMGRIAATMADEVVLTSDNPRSEDPAAILAEIERGVRETGRRALTMPERGQAIAAAIRNARAGDVVVIAGKGHERYQEIAGRKVPFDERTVARLILDEIERERRGAASA
jgi:UDP-N-acetylmuramoyl-L-alanyl-D-glutamate--2,6-diaminopimelate ligase